MNTGGDRSFGIFQIVVLVLSVYALGALVIDLVVSLDPETSRLIRHFDLLVCAVFLADFLHQFIRAENKSRFMRWGWIDLVASIPTLDALRWGRAFRMVRILRVLRAIRGTQKLYQLFRQKKAVGGSVALTAFMLIVISSLSILSVEKAGDSNIKSAGDALWWSITTVTTVGYGDLYPVTQPGRLIATVLMLGGVGLFGSLTALIAATFTAKDIGTSDDEIMRELKALKEEIITLRARLPASPQP